MFSSTVTLTTASVEAEQPNAVDGALVHPFLPVQGGDVLHEVPLDNASVLHDPVEQRLTYSPAALNQFPWPLAEVPTERRSIWGDTSSRLGSFSHPSARSRVDIAK
jgi:hypothetical protein